MTTTAPTITTTGLAAVPDRVEADGGPLRVLPPIDDSTIDLAPSALAGMRENPELSLCGENFFRWRCCGGPLARPWISPCSPAYTGEIGQGDPPTRWDPNVEGGGITASVLDADHKCSETCLARSLFRPFTFYNLQQVDCVTPTFDLEDEAELQVRRNAAWWLTAELDHAPLTANLHTDPPEGNPAFRSFGWDLTPTSGAVSPAQALTILMRAYRSQGMGSMVLWAPWEALPAFTVNRLVTSRSGGIYRTVGQVPVVFGPGLSGVLPWLDATGTRKTTAPDEALPAAGTIALYATRSVAEYRLGPPTAFGDGLISEARTNHLAAESFRTAAVRFDPGCVYAVACNLDQGTCG
jgi:hypothetical protein